MGEICPETASYLPSQKAKINFNPPPPHPPLNDNIKVIILSFFEAQFNHTVLYLPYFKLFVLLFKKFQQLGFSCSAKL